MKALKKLETEFNFLRLIKRTDENLKGIITLNNERLITFPLGREEKVVCFYYFYLALYGRFEPGNHSKYNKMHEDYKGRSKIVSVCRQHELAYRKS